MPLLQPGGVVIPATALVYGQLVECPILAAQSQDLSYQQSSHAPMSKSLANQAVPSSSDKATLQHAGATAGSSAHAQMRAAHVDPLYPNHLKVLCKPFEVFRFDFANPPAQDGAELLQVQFVHAYDIDASAHRHTACRKAALAA